MIEITFGNNYSIVMNFVTLLLSLISISVTSVIAYYTIKYQKEFYEYQRQNDQYNLEISKLNIAPYIRLELRRKDNMGVIPHHREIILDLVIVSKSPVILHDLFLEDTFKNPYRGIDIKTISKRLYVKDEKGSIYNGGNIINILSFAWNDHDGYKDDLRKLCENYILILKYSNTINKEGKVDGYLKKDMSNFYISSIPIDLSNLKQFL